MRKFGLVLLLLAGYAAANAGSISGRVGSSKSDIAVPGIKVQLKGTNRRTSTDEDGRYRFNSVDAGTHTLILSGIGYTTDTLTVQVEAGASTEVNVRMAEPVDAMNRMLVVGNLKGQRKAYNIQKSADNIRNIISADYITRFPDQNSAEALQRVSGISVARDQGEGRYVQIRGAEPRMTDVNINGVQVPSPEGDVRTVALDVVPSDILGTIEVNKAITPEMDGDAIGGSVNLETPGAADSALALSATASLGYNDLTAQRENGPAPLNGQGSFALSKRFGRNEIFGMVLGGSYMKSNRSSDNIEFDGWDSMEFNTGGTEYDEDDPAQERAGEYTILEEIELRDYLVTRERIGASAHLDWKLNDLGRVYISGLYNRFGDDENRRRTKIGFGDGSYAIPDLGNADRMDITHGAISMDIKDRYEVQDIISTTAGFELELARMMVDGKFSWSYAQEEEPDRYNSEFEMEDVNMGYDISDREWPKINRDETAFSSGQYTLKEIELEDNLTRDVNVEGALDVTVPLTVGGRSLKLKSGIKGRQQQKDRDNTYELYEPSRSITMADVSDEDYSNGDFLEGRYVHPISGYADPEKVIDLYENNTGDFARASYADEIEDNWAGDYDAKEIIGAGYVQGKIEFDQFSVLAGLRGEYTGSHYDGYNVNIKTAEAMADSDLAYSTADYIDRAVTATSGYQKDIQILPMVHTTFSPMDNLNIRGAYTKTFARPDYYDMVPYYLLNDDGDEVELGNDSLNFTESHNVDLIAERYFENLGIVTAGIFYKSMDDFIYKRVWERGGMEYLQPVNGGNASIFGIEMNAEQQLSFLPGFASGFSIGANYTFTNSSADILDEDGNEREITVPGQAAHIANGFVGYDKFGFSTKLSLNYHDEFREEFGTSDESDRWYDEHLQLDLSVSQKLLKKHDLILFAEVVNLTDEPFRAFQKVDGEELPMQKEYYSFWTHFGLKYSF
ncbi:MAG: TonB-dependent receptor [Fibrobacterota bacterium]